MAKQTRKRKGKGPPESPTCNCVLLCDDVLVSAKNKHNLIGVIGSIVVPKVPAVIGGYVTYVRLSNNYGSATVRIALVHAETAEAVFSGEVTLNKNPADPLGVHTIMTTVPQFAVQHSGRYLFQVECMGEILAMSPIQIITPPNNTDDQE